jgi:cell division protein FtsQ
LNARIEKDARRPSPVQRSRGAARARDRDAPASGVVRRTRKAEAEAVAEKPKRPKRATKAAPEPPPAAPARPKNRPKPERIALENKRQLAETPPEEPTPPLGVRLRAALERGFARVLRPLVFLGKLLLVALTLVGVGAGGKLVERHVRTSQAFATRTLTLEGNERLGADEVLRAAGLEVGKNVFEVAPADAQSRLVRHPWIAEAEVQRRLPGTFRVRVREHRPAVLIWLDRLYLVGEDATVFKAVESGDPVDLPVVTGVDVARFTSDRTFRSSLLLEVVAVMHDYRAAGLYRREPISEIHVEEDDSISLFIGDDATEIRLGRGPFRGKLRKLRTVLDRLEDREARPAYVYLDNVRRPDRVTVRLRGSDVVVE